MKTTIKKFALWSLFLTTVAAVISCSDDADTFGGKDNYITKFTISTGGITYEASITGDEIRLEIPFDLSLDKASASVTLSENATISPDPAAISDWDNDRQFRVTAYNGQYRVYAYRLMHSDRTNAGSVYLQTQADVEKFAASGLNEIEGNLMVGTTVTDDPVTDLSPLESIKRISNDLVIGDYFEGSALYFSKLEYLGGFYMGSLETQSTTPNLMFLVLPKLQTIIRNFIVHNSNVAGIQMPRLTHVGGSFYVSSIVLDELEFPKLESVTESIKLWGASFGVQGNSASYAAGSIKTIRFPELQSVGGSMEIKYHADLRTVTCPKLVTVENDLLFSWVAKMNELDFSALKAINGTLTFIYSVGVGNIDGMPSLSHAGAIRFESFIFDKEKLDLSKIVIDSDLVLKGCKGTLEEIAGPEVINGEFRLESNKNFPVPPRISNIRKVHLLLDSDNAWKSDISYPIEEAYHVAWTMMSGGNTINVSFPELKTVGAQFLFRNFTNKEAKLLDLPKLVSVGSQFYSDTKIRINAPELVRVGGETTDVQQRVTGSYTFEISSAQYLGDGDPATDPVSTPVVSFPKLKEVDGQFFVSLYSTTIDTKIDFPELESVNGYFAIGDKKYVTATYLNTTVDKLNFPKLKYVQTIRLSNMKSLADFSTFDTLIKNSKLSNETWTVVNCGEYLPTYDDMVAGDYTKPSAR